MMEEEKEIDLKPLEMAATVVSSDQHQELIGTIESLSVNDAPQASGGMVQTDHDMQPLGVGEEEEVGGGDFPLPAEHISGFQVMSDHSNSVCTNCNSRKSSIWRCNEYGDIECNACNHYFRKNGWKRSVWMNS